MRVTTVVLLLVTILVCVPTSINSFVTSPQYHQKSLALLAKKKLIQDIGAFDDDDDAEEPKLSKKDLLKKLKGQDIKTQTSDTLTTTSTTSTTTTTPLNPNEAPAMTAKMLKLLAMDAADQAAEPSESSKEPKLTGKELKALQKKQEKEEERLAKKAAKKAAGPVVILQGDQEEKEEEPDNLEAVGAVNQRNDYSLNGHIEVRRQGRIQGIHKL